MFFCSNGLAYYSDGFFYGLPFDFNPNLTVFSAASFCTMANCLKTTDNSLLKNNIVNAVRYKNRIKILGFTLVQKAKIFAFFSLINSLFLFLFESTESEISVKKFFVFFLLNITVNFWLFLLQYLFELFISVDYGLLFIISVYIVGVLTGSVFYRYYTIYDNSVGCTFKCLNKMNVLNYTSLQRINEMDVNLYLFALSTVGLIVLVILTLGIKIKKVDILGEK